MIPNETIRRKQLEFENELLELLKKHNATIFVDIAFLPKPIQQTLCDEPEMEARIYASFNGLEGDFLLSQTSKLC